MTKQMTITAKIIALLMLLMITACATTTGVANRKITEENGAIPPDFGKEETTMLFMTGARSYNKYMKKNVKEIYLGKYEFVDGHELQASKKYLDKEKYRYLFNFIFEEDGPGIVRRDMNTGGFKAAVDKRVFYVLDRKTNKKYKSPFKSAGWSRVQKVYLKKLNHKMGKGSIK